MPDPVIVFPVPVINKVPPAAWLKEPDPVVARFPDNIMSPAAKFIREPATVRLLKFWAPGPLTEAPDPEKTTVDVLPLKVPLFTQFPPIL